MTIQEILGQPALFRLTSTQLVENWSERERRLLVGALNFHALMAPGRTLTAHLYDEGVNGGPRTTDDETFDGLSRAFQRRSGSINFESLVVAEDREPISAELRASTLVAGSSRHLIISKDSVLESDPVRPQRQDLIGRLARRIKTRAPLLYDEMRDVALLRHRGALRTPAERRRYSAEFELGGIHADSRIVPAPMPPAGAPRAVIMGLHWFEIGGAERWAFETVRLVREAGLLPIVLSNRDSQHPWVTRAEMDGALVIPFSEPTVLSQTPGVEELLRAILSTFDVRGVVVHHNQWLYDRLAWLKHSRPGLPVVDSTHIVEYRGGGYPLSSALVSPSIDVHHVISPSLAEWMTGVQGIPADHVKMAPLGGLTVDARDARFRARTDAPFTVAFVGRITRQKAPEVFVAMAKRLSEERSDVRFIMHGDGELSSWLDDVIGAAGLTDRIERRTSQVPVALTMEDAHLLVVSSHNEGLTLTTLEAIAHGVPVVSTNVGAQRDVIPEEALVSRGAHIASRDLARIVLRLLADDSEREALWKRERKAEKKLLATPSATEWFKEEVASW